jgi:hypothetical protein
MIWFKPIFFRQTIKNTIRINQIIMEKTIHTVDNIEKQIKTISNNLGDISPVALKKENERIEAKKAKKKAFYDKCKKKK